MQIWATSTIMVFHSIGGALSAAKLMTTHLVQGLVHPQVLNGFDYMLMQ